jgi:hypothetical protein
MGRAARAACKSRVVEDVDWGALGVTMAVVGCFYAAIVTLSIRRALDRTPHHVARRLQQPGDEVTVRIRGAGSAWDPGRSLGVGNGIWGRARATYRLDEARQVHLHLEPASGPAVDSFGPMPDFPTRPRRVVRAILGAYAVVSIVGFIVGFALAGDPAGRRLTVGFIGVAMGWLLLRFLTLLVGVTRAVWATAHYTSQVQPIRPPGSERRS